ncbi:hypothetical protein DFS34DRAFT_588785 [Phlyctochytrium arcticum]|nr:hypothetical protein DFS34DRAFT_588785 [Phlyctochytrium arcticum]
MQNLRIMDLPSLDPYCLHAIVLRLAHFDLVINIAAVVAGGMLGWQYVILQLIYIAVPLLKLRVLHKSNPHHVRYLSYWQRFITVVSMVSLVLVIPVFAWMSHRISTWDEQDCPEVFIIDALIPCESLKQRTRSILSLYLSAMMFGTAFSFRCRLQYYYSKYLSKYATLVREAPQSFLGNRGDGYTLVPASVEDSLA